MHAGHVGRNGGVDAGSPFNFAKPVAAWKILAERPAHGFRQRAIELRTHGSESFFAGIFDGRKFAGDRRQIERVILVDAGIVFVGPLKTLVFPRLGKIARSLFHPYHVAASVGFHAGHRGRTDGVAHAKEHQDGHTVVRWFVFVVGVGEILGLTVLNLRLEIVGAGSAFDTFIHHDDVGEVVIREARQVRFNFLRHAIGAVRLPVPIEDHAVESAIFHIGDHCGHVTGRVVRQPDVDVRTGAEPGGCVREPAQVGAAGNQCMDVGF